MGLFLDRKPKHFPALPPRVRPPSDPCGNSPSKLHLVLNSQLRMFSEIVGSRFLTHVTNGFGLIIQSASFLMKIYHQQVSMQFGVRGQHTVEL